MFTLLEMTASAQKMADTDPHGLILALIAVATVFSALVVLYFVYSLIGRLSTRQAGPSKAESRKKKAGPDDDTAAAIAMALEAELGGGVNAAIAMALHLHLSSAVHDVESGIITIAPRQSAWGAASLNFRKSPKK